MTGRPSCGLDRKGFTLVELMAVVAVVAILLAMLVPSVTAARRAAYRVVSAGNQRTIGQGIIMWAGGNGGSLPPSRVLEEDPLDLAELMRVYQPGKDLTPGERGSGYEQESMTPGDRYLAFLDVGDLDFGWDGLGHLFRGHFILEPGVFYSPAHSGDHCFDEMEDIWVHPDEGQLPSQTIYSNYHYVGHVDESGNTIKLYRNSERILIADGMRTRDDLNSRSGISVTWADNSVHWFPCSGLFQHLDPMPRNADDPPKQKQNEIIRSVFNGTLLQQLKQYELDPNAF